MKYTVSSLHHNHVSTVVNHNDTRASCVNTSLRDKSVPVFARITAVLPATAQLQKMQVQWSHFLLSNFLHHTHNGYSSVRPGAPFTNMV